MVTCLNTSMWTDIPLCLGETAVYVQRITRLKHGNLLGGIDIFPRFISSVGRVPTFQTDRWCVDKLLSGSHDVIVLHILKRGVLECNFMNDTLHERVEHSISVHLRCIWFVIIFIIRGMFNTSFDWKIFNKI